MPRSRKTSGLVWTDRYGCHVAAVGNFEIMVSWATHGGGYEVRFANLMPATKIDDLDEAKAAAVSLARKVLTKALDALPKE